MEKYLEILENPPSMDASSWENMDYLGFAEDDLWFYGKSTWEIHLGNLWEILVSFQFLKQIQVA